ncbi:unnamed protein product, partial [Scytosiphon promiscuus]
PPDGDPEQQVAWHLGKGFDVVARLLGASAVAQFQEWFLQVATRVEFDAKEAEAEEEGGEGFDGVVLPPPLASRQVLLLCPESLDKAGRTEIHGAFRSHMGYF